MGLFLVPCAPILGEDLGQWLLRDLFYTGVTSTTDLPAVKPLQETSEWTQIQILQGKKLTAPMGDVTAQLIAIRHLLTGQTFDLPTFASALASLWTEVFYRPIDAIKTFVRIVYLFSPPILFAILSLCIFQYLIWQPALFYDFRKVFKIKSPWGVYFIALAIGSAAVLSQQILWLIFLMLLTAMLYTRRRRFYRNLAIAFLFLLVTSNMWRAFHDRLELESIREAMSVGKNRIEYPLAFLDSLPPEELSQWAFWNKNFLTAQRLNEKSSESIDKVVLSIAIDANYQSPRVLIDRLEQAEKQFGRNEVLRFNLSQLYLKSQSLDLYDEIKSELGLAEYDKFLQRSRMTPAGLLPPKIHGQFWMTALKTFQDYGRALNQKWRDLSFLSFIIQLTSLIMPILVFLFFSFFLTRRTSGLCKETGHQTDEHDDDLGPLSLKLANGIEPLTLPERNQLKTAQLFFKEHLENLVRTWIWLIPGASQLKRGLCLSGLMLNLMIYIGVWAGLPTEFRSQILGRLGFDDFPQFIDWGWSPAILLITLGLIFLNSFWGIKKVGSS